MSEAVFYWCMHDMLKKMQHVHVCHTCRKLSPIKIYSLACRLTRNLSFAVLTLCRFNLAFIPHFDQTL